MLPTPNLSTQHVCSLEEERKQTQSCFKDHCAAHLQLGLDAFKALHLLTLSDLVPKGFHDRLHMYDVHPLACVAVKSSSCIVHPLTVAGAQEVLPAGPQQAGESRHAGGDLPLQQRTNSGANLQQVVWSDVSVQLHLNTRVQSANTASRTAEKKKQSSLTLLKHR